MQYSKELNIYKVDDGSEDKILLWSFSNERFDFWENGQIHVTNENPFRLEIKAIRNSKAEGYAAVDDFRIETYVPAEECPIYPEGAQPVNSNSVNQC